MIVVRTERLNLRELADGDSAFVLELLTDKDFLRYVGDRGVKDLESARAYIRNGPVESYRRNGFGLYLVELAATKARLGMCGLVKRAGLVDVDIGFAFLPQYRSRGYAVEAAAAVMTHGRDALGLTRIVAIASPDNDRSANVLSKVGLKFERMIRLADSEPEIKLFAWTKGDNPRFSPISTGN